MFVELIIRTDVKVICYTIVACSTLITWILIGIFSRLGEIHNKMK